MVGNNWTAVQSDNLKAMAVNHKLVTGSIGKKLVVLKARQKLFGPFLNYYYKLKGSLNVVTDLFKKSSKATDQQTAATSLLTKASKLLLLPLKIFNLTMALMVGKVFAIVAVFAYLTGSFGMTAGKSSILIDAFYNVKDSILNLIDTVQAIDFSPIIEPLTVAFQSVGKFLGELLILTVNVFAMMINKIGEFAVKLTEVDWSPLTNMLASVGENIIELFNKIIGLDYSPLTNMFLAIGAELLRIDLTPILDLITAIVSKIAGIDFSGVGGAIAPLLGLFVSLSAEIITVVNTVIKGLADMSIMLIGLDWSPITDMLLLAFGLIAQLVGTFLISATKAFGELFAIFTQLFMYLGDVGVFQQIIDIVGILGTSVIFAISSIFIALDILGINWSSIFGLIIGLIGGLTNALIDSGIIPFFVDVASYLAMFLAVFLSVFGVVLISLAKVASYWTGPLWTVISVVVNNIVSIIVIALAVILGTVSVVLKLLMLPWRMFFGLVTGGWGGMVDEGKKSLSQIKAVVNATLKAVWGRFKGMFGNIVEGWTAMVMLIIAPIMLWFDIIDVIVQGVVSIFTSAWSLIGDTVKSVFGAMADAGLKFLQFYYDVWSWLISSIIGLFKGLFYGIVGIMATIDNAVNSVIDSMTSYIKNKIEAAIKPFIFLKNNVGSIMTIMGDEFDSVMEKISGAVDFMSDGFKNKIDAMIAPIETVLDALESLTDIDLGDIAGDAGGFLSGIGGSAMSLFSGAKGGIARGPLSGYNATLHGNEAVVPLPDGRTIPVAIQGGGMGTTNTENVTFTINVSGGGDSAKIAKAVSQEVQRAFRTRSRSGGYGRGI